MYAWSMLFLKVSLGFFFLRIVISKVQRRIIYTTVALSTFANLVASVWSVVNCRNPNDFIFTIILQKCAPSATQLIIVYSQAIVNTTTDIILVCIPFSILRQSFLTR